jgi:transposase
MAAEVQGANRVGFTFEEFLSRVREEAREYIKEYFQAYSEEYGKLTYADREEYNRLLSKADSARTVEEVVETVQSLDGDYYNAVVIGELFTRAAIRNPKTIAIPNIFASTD